MSINDKINSLKSELNRINSAKADIASAITAKGVAVPACATIESYPALVNRITVSDSEGYYGDYIYSFVLQDVSSPYFRYGGEYVFEENREGAFEDTPTNDFLDFVSHSYACRTKTVYDGKYYSSVSGLQFLYFEAEDEANSQWAVLYGFTCNFYYDSFLGVTSGTKPVYNYLGFIPDLPKDATLNEIATYLDGKTVTLSKLGLSLSYSKDFPSIANSDIPEAITFKVSVAKKMKFKDVTPATDGKSYCPYAERLVIECDSPFDGYYSYGEGGSLTNEEASNYTAVYNNSSWCIKISSAYGADFYYISDRKYRHIQSFIGNGIQFIEDGIYSYTGKIEIATPSCLSGSNWENSILNGIFVLSEGDLSDDTVASCTFTRKSDSSYKVIYSNERFSIQQNGVEIYYFNAISPDYSDLSLLDKLRKAEYFKWVDAVTGEVVNLNTEMSFVEGNDTVKHFPKVFVYTVSDSAPITGSNNFWDSREILNGQPIYTNGDVYLQYDGSKWGVYKYKANTNEKYCYGYNTDGIIGTYQPGALSDGVGFSINVYTASPGGDSDKTYVYTVSGADIAEANGDYYQDGTLNGYPAYTNGSYWLIRAIYAYNNWAFFATKPTEGQYTGYAYYKQPGSDTSTPIDDATNYYSASEVKTSIVVAEYSGSSSGGETNTNAITVSGFGIATLQKYNTTYQLSSDGKYWKADGTSAGVLELRIYHGNHPGNDQPCWIFGDDTGTMEAFIYSTNSDPMSIVGSQSCDDAYGTSYTLTITSGGNSGGGDAGSGSGKITISGADSTDANQTYSLTSGNPDNLTAGKVVFTGDSNTNTSAWTIEFQYIPEADMTEVNVYCDLMIGMGPELQYMTMSSAGKTVAQILANNPTWTDAMGSRKELAVTYSSGGSSSGGSTNNDVIIISGAGSSQVNGTYTKTEESGTAGQIDYGAKFKTADGNGVIGITVDDASVSAAIKATLTYIGVPYYQSSTVNTVEELTTIPWEAIAAGQTPVPTVTFGS